MTTVCHPTVRSPLWAARSSRVWRVVFGLVMATWLCAAPALAQSPFAESPAAADVARARALSGEGKAAFDEGAYRRAIQKFKAAEKLIHAPPHLLFIARSNVKLGNLVAAKKVYRRLVDESLGASAPAPFRRAQEEGQADLEELIRDIPTLIVVVVGAELPTIEIDGNIVTDGEHEVDPGVHTVRVTDGTEERSETVSLARGVRETVTVTFAGALADDPEGPDTDGWSPPMVPLVLAGLGAAGLIVGAVAGGLAASKVDDIRAACPNNPCPASLQESKDDATSLATASTVGFVVGGVLAAAGITWLVVDVATSDDETVGWLVVRGQF